MPFGFAGRDASILLPSLPPSPWANAGLKRRVYITLQTHYCSPRRAIGHQNKPDSTLKSVNRFLGNCLEFLPSPCPKQLFIWCSGTELIWERIRNSTLLTVVTGVSQCDSWLSPSRISLTNSIAPVNRVKVNTGSSSLGPGCVPPPGALPGPLATATSCATQLRAPSLWVMEKRTRRSHGLRGQKCSSPCWYKAWFILLLPLHRFPFFFFFF